MNDRSQTSTSAASRPAECDSVSTELQRTPLGDRSSHHRVVLLEDSAAERTSSLLAAVDEAARDSGLAVDALYRRDCWWTERDDDAWPAGDSAAAVVRSLQPHALVGIGVGGQGVLSLAFSAAVEVAAVAAIAPACELGVWYANDLALQRLFNDAEEARQSEAPLLIPSSPPLRNVLVACDPRDQPCLPSAIRVVSKLSASGIPVESDLLSEVGTSRNDYAACRVGWWMGFLRERLERAAHSLPLLPPER